MTTKRTIVYVDGFNLYYRALKGTNHKWLNLHSLCQAALPNTCDIIGINYYTARVSSRLDPNSPRDQQAYLSALQTIPNLRIHSGNFQVHDTWMFMVQPVQFKPSALTLPTPNPDFAYVVKTEEKGSDVNLGVHLVRDAFIGAFEHAVIITNDTDLAEPLRIVVQEARLPVTLLTPVKKPAQSLRGLATYVRHLKPYLGVSQFTDPVVTAAGHNIAKPAGW